MGWSDWKKDWKKDWKWDFDKEVDYDKDVDIHVDVDVEQHHKTTLYVDKDIDVDIDVDVKLDLDGNSAVLSGHAESIGKDWVLVSTNQFAGLDSTDQSMVSTETLVANMAGELGGRLAADGIADGKKSYAELVYTFNFDEKGLTEIIVEGEAHGVF